MTKTFWLSFCDVTRPAGDRFVGVAVVDVSEEEAADALVEVLLRFPAAQEGADWIAAAVMKAHRTGCNPGGEVSTMEMPREWPDYETCPRNILMSKAHLVDFGLAEATP